MTEAALLSFEQNAYNDMMVLDLEENMNNGKSIDFFAHIARHYKYEFAMKTDDDCFLHLPNIAKELGTLPKTKVYFGRHVIQNNQYAGFHAGMGYVLSWDLVEYLGQNDECQKFKSHQEDAMIARCLRDGRAIPGLLEPEDLETLYDEPWSLQPWSHNYTATTLIIHRLKRSDWFLKANMHFFANNLPRDLVGDFSRGLEWDRKTSKTLEEQHE